MGFGFRERRLLQRGAGSARGMASRAPTSFAKQMALLQQLAARIAAIAHAQALWVALVAPRGTFDRPTTCASGTSPR
jgi:hypothetical protein